MICQKCKIPMKTEDGSENGVMEDDFYHTEEIKVCKKCGLKVRESYTAKILIESKET